MKDKYSSLEEKIEDGLLRSSIIEGVLGLVLRDNQTGNGDMFTWEIVSVKVLDTGKRLNVVEVKTKNSTVRFFMNYKIKEIQNMFTKTFEDKGGIKEFLNLRIR